MSNPRPVSGPIEGFVVFAVVNVSYTVYWQPVLILILLNFTFIMQVVLSATSSRLLPLQLEFERFQYISLS